MQIIEAAQDETQTFAALCIGCHNISTEVRGIGPSLFDVVDRRIGSRQSYRYSAAMARSRGLWTEARLDAFLRDPAADMPGTKMEFEGISDPATRTALIGYLKGL